MLTSEKRKSLQSIVQAATSKAQKKYKTNSKMWKEISNKEQKSIKLKRKMVKKNQ